jgi:hypothetical protein
MYIPFRGRGLVPWSNWLESVVGLFAMSVGEFEDFYAMFEELPTPFVQMVKVRMGSIHSSVKSMMKTCEKVHAV